MMVRAAFISLLIVAASLCATTVAEAEPFTAELEDDYSSAFAWWGVEAPPQCENVSKSLLPTDPYGGQHIGARATQPVPGAFYELCTIEIYADGIALATPCDIEMIFRHEVGHLLGLAHSADPNSIMAPAINYPLWCPSDVPTWKHRKRYHRKFVRGYDVR